jgi:hypothetical protein
MSKGWNVFTKEFIRARENLRSQTARPYEEWCLLGCYAVWLL